MFEIVILNRHQNIKFGTHISLEFDPSEDLEQIDCKLESTYYHKIENLNEEIDSQMNQAKGSSRSATSIDQSKQQMICFKSETKNLYSSDINFEIKKCLSSEQEGCHNFKDISYITGPQRSFDLEVYIEENKNSFESNQKQAKTGLRRLEVSISLDFLKRVDINMIELDSLTSSGFIVNNTGFASILFKGISNDILQLNKGIILAHLNVVLDKNRKIFTRQVLYQLNHVVSFLGGLIKGVTLLIFCIVYPFREISYYQSLVNEMFRICHTPEQLKKQVSLQTTFKQKCETPLGSKDQHNEDSTILRKMKTKRLDKILKECVDHLDDMKARFLNGGLFYRLMQEDKNQKMKLIQEELSKKSGMSQNGNFSKRGFPNDGNGQRFNSFAQSGKFYG